MGIVHANGTNGMDVHHEKRSTTRHKNVRYITYMRYYEILLNIKKVLAANETYVTELCSNL
jgi:hypothetical protein